MTGGHLKKIDGSDENSKANGETPEDGATTSSNDKDKIWPYWIKHYKDFIELVLIAVAVTVAVFTLFSIERQVKTAISQTEAVWYSNRPILTMKSIEAKKDIRPWNKPVWTPSGTIKDSSLFHSLKVTFQNVGQSPAELDTIRYKMFIQGHLFTGFKEISTIFMPDQNIRDEIPTKLSTGAINYLRIHFTYYREQRKLSAEPLYFQRDYALLFKDSGWEVGLYSSNSFDSLLASGDYE